MGTRLSCRGVAAYLLVAGLLAGLSPAVGRAAYFGPCGSVRFTSPRPVHTSLSLGSPVVAADFTRDGRPDLAMVSGGRTISVVVNGPDGFGAPQIAEVGPMLGPLAAGDFNRDGNLDLVVGQGGSGGRTVYLLIGTGSGSFAAPALLDAPASEHALAVSDFNRDGKLDLAVSSFVDGTVWVLLGTGTGQFGTPSIVSIASGVHTLLAGDVNSDGVIDLVTANDGTAGRDVSVLLRRRDGSFVEPTHYDLGLGYPPTSLQFADVNRDGTVDLVVATASAARLSVLLGSRLGSLGTPSHYWTGDQSDPYAFAMADLDGDDTLDAVVTNRRFPRLSFLRGIGNGGFGPATTMILGSVPSAIAADDFDRDGKPDVALGQSNSGPALLLNGCFEIPEQLLPEGTVRVPYAVALRTAGGTEPTRGWTVASGQLPPGIRLDGTSGTLAGTPTKAGRYIFTVRAWDSSSPSETVARSFTLTVNPAIHIITRKLPAVRAGQPFGIALLAKGGATPHRWTAADGALPSGLSLSEEGVLSGSLGAGRYKIAVQVTDAAGANARRWFDLRVQ